MTDPMMFSMEALLAEKDQDIGAGLPESVRNELEAKRQTAQRAKERAERLERLIVEYETCLAEVQHRLEELRREHAQAKADAAA